MFSIEVRVNSQLVSHIYVRNVGLGVDVDDPANLYSYRYYESETGKQKRGVVFHKRGDGINVLTNIIFNDLLKEGREDD